MLVNNRVYPSNSSIRFMRTVGESSNIQKAIESRNNQWKLNFSQNSWPYIVLKLPHDPHGHASSPTQCWFFIDHSLHSCNACSLLVRRTPKQVSCMCICFSSSHFVDVINNRMYLSNSPPVKPIYYNILNSKYKQLKKIKSKRKTKTIHVWMSFFIILAKICVTTI